jgi:hypothetical protein
MDRAHTLTKKLALTMWARDGIAAIWQLHLASAEAHLNGYPSAAASISEIAEAAEEAWMRAEGRLLYSRLVTETTADPDAQSP